MGVEDQSKIADAERPASDETTTTARPVRLPLGRDDEIAAGVHEVQNALASVLGWLEIARVSMDAALRERALEVIHNGVQRARSLVATLADPSERFSVRPRPFRVAPIVAETYELLHPRAASAGVALVAAPGDADVVANGDPDRLVQILTNLVLNAVDAVLALPARASERGRVELAVASDERHVSIVVRDDGVGMDDATLARVFEPFFTTHPAANGRRKAGTGLGLAIARAMTEAMRGSLGVESTPGEGTTITITLPREGALPSVAPLPEERGLPPGTRVLVVDDEPAIRELLEVALALRGADVTMAATLTEARHALAHNTFDVALVDETLGPNDSGAALVVDLARAMPGLAGVLMTGAPSVEHLPGDACRWLLRKPFSLDDVVRLIAKAMETVQQG
jgi:CheY-like chemotaxis protein/anti-sigma regulatory factor (Ser/Thr protein kinase)